MLTLQECLQYCELTEDEIHAIAEHEHLSDIVAAELADCLLHSEGGEGVIRRYLTENIASAETQGRRRKALHLQSVLEHFNQTHPSS